FLEGNHEARISKYLHNYAPAVAGLVPSLEQLLGFEEYEVTYCAQPYQICDNLLAIHGNKLSTSQNSAGQSAFKERMRHGQSIVQGHSHRAGLIADTQGEKRFYSMECGHLMDISQAGYLDFNGVANWQQAFGLIRIDGGTAFPSIHYIDDGRATVDGYWVYG
ncbi:MAG: hypothetical protein ACRDSH_04420, partial [Pseudonocardiaceae bacterium]